MRSMAGPKVKKIVPRVLLVITCIAAVVFLVDLFLFREVPSIKFEGSMSSELKSSTSIQSVRESDNSRSTTSSWHYAPSNQRISLIILKLPRSGSSWMTQLLNEDPNTFVTKEIIQHRDVIKGDVDSLRIQFERHLHSALLKPSRKYSSASSIFPDGRFTEDYLFHPEKIINNQRYLGFTLNPEHVRDVNLNWTNVISGISRLRLIVYLRSNIVKASISGFSGGMMHTSCGISNIRVGQNLEYCNVPATVNWTIAEFIEHVNFWQNRTANFINYVLSDKSLSGLSRTVLHYESLQKIGEFSSIHELLKLEPNQPRRKLMSFKFWESLVRNNQSNPLISLPTMLAWKKRTSEKLSDVLENYQSIRNYLQSVNCTCLLRQLESTKPIVHDINCLNYRLGPTSTYKIASINYAKIYG